MLKQTSAPSSSDREQVAIPVQFLDQLQTVERALACKSDLTYVFNSFFCSEQFEGMGYLDRTTFMTLHLALCEMMDEAIVKLNAEDNSDPSIPLPSDN